MQSLLAHIEEKAGMPGLADLLHERLSGSELNTLLLELFRRRTEALSAPQVLQQFAANRFVTPSAIDQLHYLEYDAELIRRARESGFRALQLSPLAPLGTCSAIGLVDQNNVVSALRGAEVVADATNVLALQVARDTKTNGTKEPLKYCTVHRHVRSQGLTEPWHTAHFSIFCAVSGGYDTGSYSFELTALKDHLALYLSLLQGQFAPKDLVLRLYLKEENPTFQKRLEEHLDALPKGMTLQVKQAPDSTAYYQLVQFKFFARLGEGEINLIDGGFVDWTQKLLQNRKHRLLISGAGTDLLLKLKLGLI
jgi:hypothetical protein